MTMTPEVVQLIIALFNAGVEIVDEIVKAVQSARQTGDPWAALAAERVEAIDAALKLPVDVAAALVKGQ